ncbi:uncharacterized protein Fot_33966 [Forsythia ovata]|uniref:Uncharacterized protein n=1 Tax=Forsythia ovata TaxID=205694 RepID=A0ABD1TC72_9LAMI
MLEFLLAHDLSKFINYCNEVKAATAANKDGGQLSIVKPQLDSSSGSKKFLPFLLPSAVRRRSPAVSRAPSLPCRQPCAAVFLSLLERKITKKKACKRDASALHLACTYIPCILLIKFVALSNRQFPVHPKTKFQIKIHSQGTKQKR